MAMGFAPATAIAAPPRIAGLFCGCRGKGDSAQAQIQNAFSHPFDRWSLSYTGVSMTTERGAS
jgi:hypothetical protein